jgi:hypothetical protein
MGYLRAVQATWETTMRKKINQRVQTLTCKLPKSKDSDPIGDQKG